jgi:hypothetical protein
MFQENVCLAHLEHMDLNAPKNANAHKTEQRCACTRLVNAFAVPIGTETLANSIALLDLSMMSVTHHRSILKFAFVQATK